MSNQKLAVKKGTDSTDESKPQEVAEQGHVELFGREFRIVQNGLDPDEVVDYLQNASDTSNATFKHLEQFSAIQAVAKTMEESVAQAKRLAETAREQAEDEAQQEKARVIEDAKRQAAENVRRVTKTYLTSLDTVYSALLEAIKDAFEKTKETATKTLAEMEENAQDEVVAQLEQSIPDTKQPEEGASGSEAGDSEVITVEGKEETQFQRDDGPDLAGLYKSWENLRESERLLEATIRDNSASVEGEKPADTKAATQSEVENDPQGEVEQEPARQADDIQGDEEQEPSAVTTGSESDEEEYPGAETAGDESGEKGSDLYRGNVTLVLPKGVPVSWRLDLKQRILETPGAQILSESYTYEDEDGDKLMLSLSEPLALPDILRELPGVIRVTDPSNAGAHKRKGFKWLSGNHQQQQILVIELGGNAIRQLLR
ncbi:MAG TPA: hypothetical protein VMW13_06620 [Dehalococcoidales bacterium]|nr:hypothetical protein [Dehalococcoidales bacterium]